MVEKREPAPGWPILKGEYEVGDPKNCVLVITCGSHLPGKPILDAGAAITGSCKTENLGIEKVVAHIISNPNIRYLLVTGSEVKGHVTGQSMLALHANGVKENRIDGALGAIPYVENLNAAAIARFQEQVEAVNLIDTEDMGVITAKVRELASKDPGAFDAEPMIVEISEEGEGEEEEGGVVRPVSGEIALLRSRMKAIEERMINIGNLNKFHAGVHAGKIEGVMIGLTVTISLLGLLLLGR
ncbi:tetrahydromethanopterin S-methyltransferase, subunit A [Methanosarcina thermophila]|jgi:tetrahydromethanopterin S-methyltransferase subunit A|uniref:Tetrahydromethanopterin S-methyltransferase subunit A n=3 Tax=Methanosarcina thermophila TaxID=2210 RepID=A0A1I7AYG5_METTE|nr:tetrahydromethanopterin S-methyltransferase subunit A [Methanosarcina thermophila]ALK05038.1 MAG: tetrahydromethanopterin S-methyltransferase subunit A [Methanosarcina sp. 795]AKB13778.1 N5-methyltetrahydromethanopterin:coenzyme M methyltransferase subunit A [Methanosarcina thermophila TM-1]AKB15583.1 N5-methyltetrahydromethanopterin:coenzyme M methyltransferase subunit A [Methanosarcina thermophila CHTI-55]NLU57849.1 tetrahydromethanopterin S-methyltransferase subunit A [Methanosarcina ther